MQAVTRLIKKIALHPSTEELILFIANDDEMTKACVELHNLLKSNNQRDIVSLDSICRSHRISLDTLSTEVQHILTIFAPKTISNEYEILGLEAGADSNQVKRAFRKLSIKYHPDSSDNGNSDKFIEICQAYKSIIRQKKHSKQRVSHTSSSWKYKKKRKTTSRQKRKNIIIISSITIVLLFISIALPLMYKKKVMLINLNTTDPTLLNQQEKHDNLLSTEGNAQVKPATEKENNLTNSEFQHNHPESQIQNDQPASEPDSASLTTYPATPEIHIKNFGHELFSQEKELLANKKSLETKKSEQQELITIIYAKNNIKKSIITKEQIEENKKQKISETESIKAKQKSAQIKVIAKPDNMNVASEFQNDVLESQKKKNKPSSPVSAQDSSVVPTIIAEAKINNSNSEITSPFKEIIAGQLKSTIDAIDLKKEIPKLSIENKTLKVQNSSLAISQQPDIQNKKIDPPNIEAINHFFNAYTTAYESKNHQKFVQFFAPGALENDQPFAQKHDKYIHLFNSADDIELNIGILKLTRIDKNIQVEGRFQITITFSPSKSFQKKGQINFLLTNYDQQYLIDKFNYIYDKID